MPYGVRVDEHWVGDRLPTGVSSSINARFGPSIRKMSFNI